MVRRELYACPAEVDAALDSIYPWDVVDGDVCCGDAELESWLSVLIVHNYSLRRSRGQRK